MPNNKNSNILLKKSLVSRAQIRSVARSLTFRSKVEASLPPQSAFLIWGVDELSRYLGWRLHQTRDSQLFEFVSFCTLTRVSWQAFISSELIILWGNCPQSSSSHLWDYRTCNNAKLFVNYHYLFFVI